MALGFVRGINDRFFEWVTRDGPSRGSRSVHLGVIVCSFVFLTGVYYMEQIGLANLVPYGDPLFGGVHDVHRTFFLIPIVHAALIYGIKGSLITSCAFFGIVLPRALYVSPFPNPLLRSLIFVASSTVIGMLVVAWRNRLKSERKDREELAAAYGKLQDYDKRLEENQAMLVQAEKLASMGQLAASIAHEVNNPLSGVLIYIQLIMKQMHRGDVNKELVLDYLSRINFEITRSTKLIRNLLDFSSQSEPRTEEVDVNDVLDRALELAIHAGSEGARVEKDLAPLPKVPTDPEQLQEVLINLMMNAFQAMPKGGTLTLRTSVVEGEVRIAVRDTGYGIGPEIMGKLFTPFFSTKKAVKGVGLGLSVSFGIVQRLKGRIDVESKVGEGSTFTVSLPLFLPGGVL